MKTIGFHITKQGEINGGTKVMANYNYKNYFKIQSVDDMLSVMYKLLSKSTISVHNIAEETGIAESTIYRFKATGGDKPTPELRTVMSIIGCSGIKCTLRIYTKDGKTFIGLNGMKHIIDETIKVMPISYKEQLFKRSTSLVSDYITIDILLKLAKWYDWKITVLDDIKWAPINANDSVQTEESAEPTTVANDDTCEETNTSSRTTSVSYSDTYDKNSEMYRFIFNNHKDIYNEFLKEVVYNRVITYISEIPAEERKNYMGVINKMIAELELSDDESIKHDVTLIKMLL